MAYRIGYCSQCGTQVMVQDTKGKWSSFKANFKQIDVAFGCGHKMRVHVCTSCAASPDYQKIIDEVTDKKSKAADKEVLEMLKSKGTPVSHEIKA